MTRFKTGGPWGSGVMAVVMAAHESPRVYVTGHVTESVVGQQKDYPSRALSAGFCPHGLAWVGSDPHPPIADPYY